MRVDKCCNKKEDTSRFEARPFKTRGEKGEKRCENGRVAREFLSSGQLVKHRSAYDLTWPAESHLDNKMQFHGDKTRVVCLRARSRTLRATLALQARSAHVYSRRVNDDQACLQRDGILKSVRVSAPAISTACTRASFPEGTPFQFLSTVVSFRRCIAH